VYTRKSTEEGLDQEFNSLDAQRAAGEAYVRSQSGEGWVALPDRYDDGGFTGGNTDRPGLRRHGQHTGPVDCEVVHKADRLSRSLLDPAQFMPRFEAKDVSFESVVLLNTGGGATVARVWWCHHTRATVAPSHDGGMSPLPAEG
jgi:site-specific DNA recombinase